MIFRNEMVFYGEELLAPRPIPNLEDDPLSAVRVCLFSTVHRVQTDSGAHPTSYPIGTGGSFPGGKAEGA
jgi:hypothetical protein